MPSLLEEAFGAVGEKLEERLDLVELDPGYRARFADGSTIDVHTDADAMEEEIRRVCGPDSAAGYGRLRTWLTQLYRAEIDRFIGANFDSPLGLLGPDLARLAALGGFGRLAPRIARYLPDERLQRIFSFQALYAGVPPQQALGAYGVIAYMDTIAGVFFPRGGMRQVGRALADAAADAGAEIVYGRAVTGLEQSGGRVTAVRHRAAEGGPAERLACDAVVLTPDLPVVHRLLGRAPRRPVPLRWSPSAVVLHAGRHPDPARAGAPHHLVRRRVGVDVPGDHRRGPADERPVAAGHPADRDRPGARARRPRPAVRPRAVPEHQVRRAGPIDWPRVGPAYRDELLRVLEARGHRARRALGRDRGVAAGHTGRLGGRRDGCGHAVRPGPHVRPDRAVPAAQPRPRAGQRRARRLRHDSGGRDPAGVDLRAARRGTGHRRQPARPRGRTAG